MHEDDAVVGTVGRHLVHATRREDIRLDLFPGPLDEVVGNYDEVRELLTRRLDLDDGSLG